MQCIGNNLPFYRGLEGPKHWKVGQDVAQRQCHGGRIVAESRRFGPATERLVERYWRRV
jgi:hypothetical protein